MISDWSSCRSKLVSNRENIQPRGSLQRGETPASASAGEGEGGVRQGGLGRESPRGAALPAWGDGGHSRLFSGVLARSWLPFACSTLNQSWRRLTASFRSRSLQPRGSGQRAQTRSVCVISAASWIRTRLPPGAGLGLSRARARARTPDANLLSCHARLVVQFTLSRRDRGQIRMIKGPCVRARSSQAVCTLLPWWSKCDHRFHRQEMGARPDRVCIWTHGSGTGWAL